MPANSGQPCINLLTEGFAHHRLYVPSVVNTDVTPGSNFVIDLDSGHYGETGWTNFIGDQYYTMTGDYVSIVFDSEKHIGVVTDTGFYKYEESGFGKTLISQKEMFKIQDAMGYKVDRDLYRYIISVLDRPSVWEANGRPTITIISRILSDGVETGDYIEFDCTWSKYQENTSPSDHILTFKEDTPFNQTCPNSDYSEAFADWYDDLYTPIIRMKVNGHVDTIQNGGLCIYAYQDADQNTIYELRTWQPEYIDVGNNMPIDRCVKQTNKISFTYDPRTVEPFLTKNVGFMRVTMLCYFINRMLNKVKYQTKEAPGSKVPGAGIKTSCFSIKYKHPCSTVVR